LYFWRCALCFIFVFFQEEQACTKEEYAVAKHLRFNTPAHTGRLAGMTVKCFIGMNRRAFSHLLNHLYNDLFVSRCDCYNIAKIYILGLKIFLHIRQVFSLVLPIPEISSGMGGASMSRMLYFGMLRMILFRCYKLRNFICCCKKIVMGVLTFSMENCFIKVKNSNMREYGRICKNKYIWHTFAVRIRISVTRDADGYSDLNYNIWQILLS
jgi:hypothetical protein